VISIKNVKQKNKKSLFFSFTPKFTFAISLFLVILFFLVYLTSEYIKFHQPPKLEVIWPLEATVSSSIIEISGVTDSESTVRINDDLILVDVNGVFLKKINLNSGENIIIVESTSPNGQTTVVNKVIKSSL